MSEALHFSSYLSFTFWVIFEILLKFIPIKLVTKPNGCLLPEVSWIYPCHRGMPLWALINLDLFFVIISQQVSLLCLSASKSVHVARQVVLLKWPLSLCHTSTQEPTMSLYYLMNQAQMPQPNIQSLPSSESASPTEPWLPITSPPY